MSVKNLFKSCCLSLIFLFTALCAAARDGVAVVVDVVSYGKARAELDGYVKALEQKQGYKVYVIVDRWQVPDSIRARLMALHTQKHDAIVGAVLVGDIPVPMVRDAQYLTSAFKMDQSRDRRESSVPSDRFYDDFNLRFCPLGKDDTLPYYYYSLSAEGAQRLSPDIFSGRIRPTDAGALHATTSYVPTYARPRLPNSIQSVLAQYSCSRATVAYLNRSQPTSTSFVD